jgi:hypothetical protein
MPRTAESCGRHRSLLIASRAKGASEGLDQCRVSPGSDEKRNEDAAKLVRRAGVEAVRGSDARMQQELRILM